MNRSTVLVVEDDLDLRQSLEDTLRIAGFDVVTADSAEEALPLVDSVAPAVVVSDVQMAGADGHALLARLKTRQPDLPVLLMTAHASVERAVEAMRSGAADYLVKPFEAEVLVTRVHEHLPPVLTAEDDCIATDPATRAVLAMAARVAESDATVLVTGESGTGKEVLFRYVHAHSQRARGPAVAINCAAIPENMLEAMLFGYEKGAFTGAYKSCAGKFEQAQGGTLLLDEITEMALPLQAKLLRVLQEREVERLGAGSPIALDVRVVATTNRSLPEEVAAGRFREDLYYRLNVFPLHLPPLRERPADILPLARFLLSRAAQRTRVACPHISDEAARALQAHRWPGNVRELDNVMQRALILQSGGRVNGSDILIQAEMPAGVAPRPAAFVPALVPAEAPVRASTLPGDASRQLALPPLAAEHADDEADPDAEDLDFISGSADDRLVDELRSREREIILQALSEGGGSRKYVAEKLGISARTLRYKLARLKEQGVAVPKA
jgi:two-component system, response regulator FlrC